MFGHGIRQLVTNGALQIVLGPGPRIALIAQIALGDHQQGAFAVGVMALHGTEQRRNIRVARRREVSAHFQLRVHASAELTNEFEHQGAADHHRAVGLLGRQVTNLAVFIQTLFSPLRGRGEPDLTCVAVQHRTGV